MICRANQWTGFYMIGTSVMKELKSNFLKNGNTGFTQFFRSYALLSVLSTKIDINQDFIESNLRKRVALRVSFKTAKAIVNISDNYLY